MVHEYRYTVKTLFHSLELQNIIWGKSLVTLDEIENREDIKMTGLQH